MSNKQPNVDRGERRSKRCFARLTTRAEFFVAIGAVVGVLGRYEVGRWTSQHAVSSFPFATFAVNIIGCLLIGVVQYLFVDAKLLSRSAQLLLGVGFCGGLTTFSTFSVETLRLLESGRAPVALVYQLMSLSGGVLAVVVGIGVGGVIARARHVAP